MGLDIYAVCQCNAVPSVRLTDEASQECAKLLSDLSFTEAWELSTEELNRPVCEHDRGILGHTTPITAGFAKLQRVVSILIEDGNSGAVYPVLDSCQMDKRNSPFTLSYSDVKELESEIRSVRERIAQIDVPTVSEWDPKDWDYRLLSEESWLAFSGEADDGKEWSICISNTTMTIVKGIVNSSEDIVGAKQWDLVSAKWDTHRRVIVDPTSEVVTSCALDFWEGKTARIVLRPLIEQFEYTLDSLEQITSKAARSVGILVFCF